MAADAGAQQILDLLNQQSNRLYNDAIAFSTASRKAPQKPYGVMPQYGVDALADMREFFRDLRAQIDAIETVDLESKTQALDGLDAIDRQFGALERSLEFGLSQPTIPKLKKSKKVGKAGVAGLRQAIKGLSQ